MIGATSVNISTLATTAGASVTILNISTPLKCRVNVAFSSAIAISSLAGLFLLSICLLVFLYYYGVGKSYVLDQRTSLVLSFLTALMATVAGVSGTSGSEETVFGVYICVITISVGCGFVAVGAILFFDSSPGPEGESANRKRIGHDNGSMGIIIWTVTVLLVLTEFLILYGVAMEHQSRLYIAILVVALIQKLGQASIYYFSLQRRYSSQFCPMASKWYFQVLSLFNFILWEESILTVHKDDEYMKLMYGNWTSMLKGLYNALLIDYRLMCCLIFLENSIEVKELVESISNPIQTMDSADSSRAQDKVRVTPSQEESFAGSSRIFQSQDSTSAQMGHYSCSGCILGIICNVAQIPNFLQYFGGCGPWSNLMTILADIVLVVAGGFFLRKNKLNSNTGTWRESDSRAVDVMVGIMGGVGFTFMAVRSILMFSMICHSHETKTKYYLIFAAIKHLFRAFSILVQMYLLVRVSVRVCSKRANKAKPINRILVPVLIAAQFSMFLTGVIDQYSGVAHKILAESDLDLSVKFFLEAGAPVYLGFCLHMTLHFIIVQYNMATTMVRVSSEQVGLIEEVFSDDFNQDEEA